MKPSEVRDLKQWRIETDGKLLPVSRQADPPITQEEARAAGISVCRWHDGLVRMTGDKDGAVFYCPKGKEYWRFTKKDSGFHKAISYSNKGIV